MEENFTMAIKKFIESIPVGPLAIVALSGSKSLGQTVDAYISDWRSERIEAKESPITFKGYVKDSYLLNVDTPRFGTGEAKCTLRDTVRGCDLYIIDDVTNYSVEYTVCGHKNHMSPDDHYADIKRVIAAASGKARKITVIMPFLYESRQHRRSSRESMDCAVMLQELVNMGVDNILTFDAHDPRVNNAIPVSGFESIMPTYQFIKNLLRNVDDLVIDADHLMVISPDEGASFFSVRLTKLTLYFFCFFNSLAISSATLSVPPLLVISPEKKHIFTFLIFFHQTTKLAAFHNPYFFSTKAFSISFCIKFPSHL